MLTDACDFDCSDLRRLLTTLLRNDGKSNAIHLDSSSTLGHPNRPFAIAHAVCASVYAAVGLLLRRPTPCALQPTRSLRDAPRPGCTLCLLHTLYTLCMLDAAYRGRTGKRDQARSTRPGRACRARQGVRVHRVECCLGACCAGHAPPLHRDQHAVARAWALGWQKWRAHTHQWHRDQHLVGQCDCQVFKEMCL